MNPAPHSGGAKSEQHWGRTLKRAAPVAVCAALSSVALAMPAIASAKGNPYNVTTKVAIAPSVKPIYRLASTKSKITHWTAISTPDGEALETYKMLGAKWVRNTLWEHIAVPARPNGQTGWVKRRWLASPIVSHKLVVVNQPARTLTVYFHGKVIFNIPVGVGAVDTPTPDGRFWIAEGFSSNDPFYGPWAFGTTDRATDTDFPDGSIVGIHGTNEPELIPGAVSHGCIRLKDEDIVKLKALVTIGTPVWIE
jgi:lipoprotein-anchoring transpeptidase ErfK/SrfK